MQPQKNLKTENHSNRLKPLEFTNLDPKDLRVYKNNPRKHSSDQLSKLRNSVEASGVLEPILIDEHKVIVSGHLRHAYALDEGLRSVPTVCVEGLSDTQIKALRIALNRIPEDAEWDPEKLANEFEAILEVDHKFDLGDTGFEVPEINLILSPEPDQNPENVDLPDSDALAVTKMGDLWELGDHLLLCGDSREHASFDLLMDGGLADAGFTDPPYDVKVDGHVGGSGKIKHREFAMGSGEMGDVKFTDFLTETVGNTRDYTRDGGVIYTCMDWRHIKHLFEAGERLGLSLLNLCVWVKSNGGMGSLYRSRHELVAVFRKGTTSHMNNVQLGKYGRYRTNVWEYPGVNTFRNGRMEELAMHPTVKPVAMVADAILDVTSRGDVVLDPFGGSGSTLIAAEKIGRAARLIEYDPVYCDVIIRRWQDLTGRQAKFEATGRTFDETEAQLLLDKGDVS